MTKIEFKISIGFGIVIVAKYFKDTCSQSMKIDISEEA